MELIRAMLEKGDTRAMHAINRQKWGRRGAYALVTTKNALEGYISLSILSFEAVA